MRAATTALNTLPLQNYTGTNFPTDTTANNFAIINSTRSSARAIS